MDIQHITCDGAFSPSKIKANGMLRNLYYVGNIQLLEKKCISVIGRRDTSVRYEKISYRVGKLLAKNGYVVMNGLARGCDKQAIAGALSGGGQVIAVLPCGLDTIYPSSCRDLAYQIIETGGCLISQYPVGVKPVKYRFLERDKVQVQIADGIFVVDSGLKGGTMFTAIYALQSGKRVECFVESGQNLPEGNYYITDKYRLHGVRNADELLRFAGGGEPVQLALELE